MKYFYGQRVIVSNNTIAMVIRDPKAGSPPTTPSDYDRVWVRVLHSGVEMSYDPANVQPLPGGQL